MFVFVIYPFLLYISLKKYFVTEKRKQYNREYYAQTKEIKKRQIQDNAEGSSQSTIGSLQEHITPCVTQDHNELVTEKVMIYAIVGFIHI